MWFYRLALILFFFWLFSLAGRRNQAAAFWAYLICYVILGHVVPWLFRSNPKATATPLQSPPPLELESEDEDETEANDLQATDHAAWPPPLHTNPPALPVEKQNVSVEEVNPITRRAKTIQERLAEDSDSNTPAPIQAPEITPEPAPRRQPMPPAAAPAQAGVGPQFAIYFAPNYHGELDYNFAAENPVDRQYMLRIRTRANASEGELSLSIDHPGQEVRPFDIAQNRDGLLSSFIEADGFGNRVTILANGTVRLEGNVWLVVEKIKVRFT